MKHNLSISHRGILGIRTVGPGAQRVLFTCLGPKGLMVYFESIGVALFKKWFLTRRNDDNEP